MTVDPVKDQNQDQRTMVVKLVRKWGDLNTGAVLDPHCSLFFIPSIDGFIGYRIELNCAVVFGEPVCSHDDKAQLIKAFRSFCEEKHLNIVYIIISKDFADIALEQHNGVLIQFGNKLVLDPHDNPSKRTGSQAVLLRKKVKHALKAGITVTEYKNEDLAFEKEIENIGNSWLQSRKGPQVYIAHLNIFQDKEGKRWFYASKNNRVMGFLVLNAIQEGSGWLLNNVILASDAPSGTSELLINSVFETLQENNCSRIIIGPVIGVGMKAIGLRPFSTWFLKMIFQGMKRIFRLEGQKVFWGKFSPKEEPSYVLLDKVNFRSVQALMKAMNVKLSNKQESF